jgi:hypothetical protein
MRFKLVAMDKQREDELLMHVAAGTDLHRAAKVGNDVCL